LIENDPPVKLPVKLGVTYGPSKKGRKPSKKEILKEQTREEAVAVVPIDAHMRAPRKKGFWKNVNDYYY
jgi:hypothetical protein